MNTLTVVVTGDNERDSEVRQIAARWSSAGILNESLWLTCSDVDVPRSGPPHVRARVLGNDGQGEPEDLFRLIAVRRLSLVRVVVMQLLAHDGSYDADLIDIGRRVAELVKDVLPRDVSASSDGGTALVRVNLLVPETRSPSVSRELLASGWEVNALASPEDRPDLQHASVLVRTDVNLHAHALAAVSCVGGLWPGVEEGVFDDVEADSSGNESDLVVFRPSARMLLGDSVAQKLADQAIALVQDPEGEGASAYVPWAGASHDPSADVERAHEELMGRGEWAIDPLDDMDPPPKMQLGVKEAFGDLALFQLRLVRAAGRLVRNTATRWVEDQATKMTAGDEGAYVVRVQPQTVEQMLSLAKDKMQAQTASLHGGLLRREAGKMKPPQPSTWVELRQLCFGLVDGSPLPAGFSPPERASSRQILPPRWVVPRPGDPFAADDRSVVTTPRQESLLWQVARSVSQREAKAREVSEEAYKCAVDDSLPDADGVRRARRRLIWCWIVMGVVTLGAGVLAAVMHWGFDSLTLRGLLRGLGLLLCLNLALWLAGGAQFYRALSRFEHKVQGRVVERQHAGERFVVASREARRLGLLYDGLLDWAQVIGHVIHHPWAPRKMPEQDLALDLEDLPASVAVATPAPDSDLLPSSLTLQAVAFLCRRGWVRQVFDQVVAQALDVQGASAADRGHLPADLDSGLTNNGPRRRLASFVASEDTGAGLADRARERIAGAVREGTLQLPVRRVVRVGKYASPDPVTDAEFFRRALGPGTPFVAEVWTHQGMQDRRHLVSESVAWLPRSRTEATENVEIRAAAGNASMRVDFSGTCDPKQIALFTAGEPRRPLVVASGEWV